MKYSDTEIEKLIEGIYDGSVTKYKLPKSLYNAIASHFEKGLYKGFGMNLTEAVGKDFELLTELRENVYMFSAAKTFQQVKEIGGLMINEDGTIRTQREFRNIGRATFDQWNSNWGNSEYNTAVGQATNAIKWREIEGNKHIFPILLYSAVMDLNTSKICAALNGLSAPVNDPIWNKVCPLNHFNCRCVLMQKEADHALTPDHEKEAAVKSTEEKMSDVFKMNSGKDGYVFKPDHPYFEVHPKDKSFARENFGLPMPPPVPVKKKETAPLSMADRIKDIKIQAVKIGAENDAEKVVLKGNVEASLIKLNLLADEMNANPAEALSKMPAYRALKEKYDLAKLELNHLSSRYANRVADLLASDNGVSSLKVDFTSGFSKKVVTLEDGVGDFKKIIGKDLLDGKSVSTKLIKSSRESFTPHNNTMNIGSTTSVETICHELGHGLEALNDNYFTKIKDYLNSRTVGEKPVKLSKIYPGQSYGSSEITKRDHFIDPYTGKIYQNSTRVYGTEITSMWFTHALTDLDGFIKKDPDHFEFIFKLFNKAK